MWPIVGRRDLDPARKFAAADALKIAKRSRGDWDHASSLGDLFEDADLPLRSQGLRRREKGRVVVIISEFPRSLFGFFWQCGDGLGALNVSAFNPQVASREAIAALVAPPPRNVRNLRRFFRLPLFLREPGVFRDLLGTLNGRQLCSMKVLDDRPKPSFEVVEVHDTHKNRFVLEEAERLDPMSSCNEDIAATALNDRRRAL
jgi:hypothetical protein